MTQDNAIEGATTERIGDLPVVRGGGTNPGRGWRRSVLALLAAICVVTVAVAIKAIGGRVSASAEDQSQPSAPNKRSAPASKKSAVRLANATSPVAGGDGQTAPQIVAIVNGEEIQRQELARECLKVYGNEVLESLVNKRLILQHCERRQIQVTRDDVNAEIARMATKFGLATDQYLKMLKQERGIKPEQYANEIVWPMLALRQLARDRIVPSAAEVDEAFEAQYGEAVKCRIIVLDDLEKARVVQAEAAAKPDDFGSLARSHSKDPSRSMNGMIQPIRRFVGDKRIEKAAFGLQENQVSAVIPVKLETANTAASAPTQYVILKCEGRLPALKVDREKVDARLKEAIVERKLRAAAAQIFEQLQNESKLVNVYGDPKLRQEMPGIAAVINDQRITVRELSDECVARHGVEVLEGTISRRLLEQALKSRNQEVTGAEIDAEVARAALAMGHKSAAGEADVESWLKDVTEKQGLPVDVYRRDSVWPSVALKKLAGDAKVSNEDLKKGYEANYGPRVQCRAIVLTNQRRAQEVWDQAANNPTVEFFGQLAEQYSAEPASKALHGKVPPIQRHGGQPLLEKEAFSLKPGEISSIVQMGDKYVILFCEGFTKPTKVSFEEVRADILADLQEKKQRIAMAETFTKIKENAQIDNFLAGTMQSPTKKAGHSQELPADPRGAKSAARPTAARSSAPAR